MTDIWNLVSDIHGGREIHSPEELWLFALQYFNWVVENPLYESQVAKFPLRVEVFTVPRMRAMSLDAFLVISGLAKEQYEEVRAQERYRRVCFTIETIIYTHKFDGAAAGLLKEQLIARDLGLVEKVDHTSSDRSMSPGQVDPELVKNLTDKLMGVE